MTTEVIGFKNTFFDHRTDSFHIWELFSDGSTKHKKLDYSHDVYLSCKKEEQYKNYVDVYGSPVKKMSLKRKTYNDFKKEFDGKIQFNEGTLNPAFKVLHDIYETSSFKPSLESFNSAFIDIEIETEPEDGFPYPHIAKWPINLITVYSSKTKQYYTFGKEEYTKTENSEVGNYAHIQDEAKMLHQFCKWFKTQQFDLITGWNIDRFDIPYIIRRCEFLKIHDSVKLLSPLNRYNLKIELEDKEDQNYDDGDLLKEAEDEDDDGRYIGNKKVEISWEIPGLTSLDYILLYKKFTFTTRPSYTLQSIAMIELKEGKLELDGSVNTEWKTNWPKFVDYNIQDVALVLKLEKKMKLMSLAISIANKNLIPISKVFSAIWTIEGGLHRFMRKQGMVIPDRKHHEDWWRNEKHFIVKKEDGTIEYQNCKEDEKYFYPFYVKGGFVKANPGLYKKCMSFDITSEYPHMIIERNMSIETKVIKPNEVDKKNLIRSELNQVYFKKHEDKHGIMTQYTQSLFDDRKFFKKCGQICESFRDGFSLEQVLEIHKMSESKIKPFLDEIKNEIGEEYSYGAYYYDLQSLVKKIEVNSEYGCLANIGFHLYDVDIARAITRGGRTMIKYLGNNINDYYLQNIHRLTNKKCGNKITINNEISFYENSIINIIRDDKEIEVLGKEIKEGDDILKVIKLFGGLV